MVNHTVRKTKRPSLRPTYGNVSVVDSVCSYSGNDLPCEVFQVKVKDRDEIRYGAWNVRTQLQPRAEDLVKATLGRNNIDVACLSEVRMSGSGSKVMEGSTCDAKSSGQVLYWSGPDDTVEVLVRRRYCCK